MNRYANVFTKGVGVGVGVGVDVGVTVGVGVAVGVDVGVGVGVDLGVGVGVGVGSGDKVTGGGAGKQQNSESTIDSNILIKSWSLRGKIILP